MTFDVCEKLWWIIRPRGAERLNWRKEKTMAWSKPEFEDLRFGFEVTMYIWNR
jgi:coenzyme PQQ precursor peptide PqqA